MKYRKKPVEVEAIKWTGKNLDEIKEFCPNAAGSFFGDPNFLTIPTLEGLHTASVGDYIIKGVHGEFYPCKPDIFVETYEVVYESASDAMEHIIY